MQFNAAQPSLQLLAQRRIPGNASSFSRLVRVHPSGRTRQEVGARGGLDDGAGGEGGGAGGHVQRAGGGQHAMGGLCIFPSVRPWSRMARTHTVQRLVSLGQVAACFNAAQLCGPCQIMSSLCAAAWSRVLVWRQQNGLRSIQPVKDTCRVAFECAKSAPSATQQQVRQTVRHEERQTLNSKP